LEKYIFISGFFQILIQGKVDSRFLFPFLDSVFFSGVGKMFFTSEILLDAELFVVVEVDAVASAASPF
jgi:hypothetical protein